MSWSCFIIRTGSGPFATFRMAAHYLRDAWHSTLLERLSFKNLLISFVTLQQISRVCQCLALCWITFDFHLAAFCETSLRVLLANVLVTAQIVCASQPFFTPVGIDVSQMHLWKSYCHYLLDSTCLWWFLSVGWVGFAFVNLGFGLRGTIISIFRQLQSFFLSARLRPPSEEQLDDESESRLDGSDDGSLGIRCWIKLRFTFQRSPRDFPSCSSAFHETWRLASSFAAFCLFLDVLRMFFNRPDFPSGLRVRGKVSDSNSDLSKISDSLA